MDWSFQKFYFLFALQALLVIQCLPSADATVGVVYGYDGDNLPPPSQVVQLLTNNFVTEVRIYDTNAEILKAFIGSNIHVVVGVTNAELAKVGVSNNTADSWVVANVLPFATSVNITAIAVGNEVLTTDPDFSSSLVQTMVWIHESLLSHGLDQIIRVSSPVSTDILQNSFPPSQSVFNQTMLPTITSMLQFINLTGSYLMLNVHTFDVFQANSGALTLKYALFEPDEPTIDAYSSLAYNSLFDALVDATYAAMESINFTTVSIVVSETGWPSVGDSNENGANNTNVQTYNANLVLHVSNKTGTPAHPSLPLTAYVYELFNEDLEKGPASERNYGLFQYNLNPVYLTGEGRSLASNGTEYQTWCVAISTATPQNLQNALNWACGQGQVNCSATLPGGACYTPNTLISHCTWVFNAYYQENGNAAGTCDFDGVAQIVSYNPSYGNCVFQASNVTTTISGTAIPPTSPNSAKSLQIQSGWTVICLVALFILTFGYLT